VAGAVSLKNPRMKHDVENIERATLAAVSPEAVLELSGWLLAFDTGTVGRAKSAVPMLHTVDMARYASQFPLARCAWL
jgi:hypothetical protein